MNDERHLWAGRFADAPDQRVFDFQASFEFDRRLFDDDVEGSLAWAEALAEAGVLSADEATATRDALTDIRERGRRDPAFVSGADEDVHAFVERQLVERIGDIGRRLHTGRSRNEQVSLDLRLYLCRRLPNLQKGLVHLVTALVDQASAAGSALMPAYTHLPTRSADARGPFLSGARRGDSSRLRARRDRARRSGRSAAGIRRRRRHRLRD